MKLTSVRLLIFALLLANGVAAQNADSDKITSDAFRDAPAPVGAVAVPTNHEKTKVIDKKFIAVMGALGGAESFRFTSRKLVLDHEYAAGAPWVSRVPANQHIVVKDSFLYSCEFLVAYELKKAHSWLPGDRFIRKFWWAYPAAMVPIHLKNAVGSVRTQGPRGCTSIECAEQQP
jgi:hypothetical protein